jgi:hypothetical protein
MKLLISFALVAFVAAECPNACSGHGTCGAKDSCSCYQNYQGNDCSERTCYFGIAHVDTPKGDLNADGFVSGPLTTVVTGSEVYPWGTTEQYPNANANEGHFYMECSNKGICDRKSGQCDCFDGYGGTACARASCPNDCSGHGTCESIKELAEMKSYDTTAHDVPTTRVAGSSDHHNYNALIEESYAYDLWDQDKTMGCKCDPVYYGADCSLKKCKYGVDPLFYDNVDGVIRQTTVVHLGSKGSGKGAISGTFKIVFYDVFGEKYVTKAINAAAGTTALAVREALEALPNGVISANNQDVTGTPPAAVTVSAQTNTGTITYEGGIGAGTEGAGAGLGAQGSGGASYGAEYTITFKSNPGVLKGIELDTRNVNNPGSPEYWVANSRQGQFASRYSTNVGRINTLKYGSKLLYTNDNWSTTAPQNSLVKVGGQEFRVTAVDTRFLTLDYAFLGADIVPVLTDTGITATAFDLTNNPDEMTVSGVTTQIIADSVAAGAGVYVRDCPMITSLTASDNIATSGTTLKIQTGHDCQSNGYSAGGDIVYRRSDDPNNQNMYMSGDGLGVATTKGLATTRGSPDVYFVDETQNQAGAKAFIKSYVASTTTATFDAAHGAGTVDTLVFANGLGPIKLPAITAADTTVASADFANFFGADFSTANTKFPLYTAVASSDAGAVAGKVLLINGRRYKIKSRASGTAAKVTLNENYAGGQLQTVCSTCVTAYTAAGTSVTVDVNILLAVDDRVLVSTKVHEDFVSTIGTATGTGGVGGTAVVPSAGTLRGAPANIGGAASDVSGLTGAGRLDLIKLTDKESNTATIITEAASPATAPYQYVAQCSNRGTCDAATGLCKCYKGYSNDNCDTQNMLAA